MKPKIGDDIDELDRVGNIPLAEDRQGEVLEMPESQLALGHTKKYYIESYGCQMNFSDSEIVASVLQAEGYGHTKDYKNADLILLNTCSIRDKAEETVRKRLSELSSIKSKNSGKLIGILGCMAERLKKQLLEEEQLVDIVCGPDAYRDLPNLIYEADTGQKAVNVLLSREETYSDISPVRLDGNGVSAFISIMRGCDNMCSFCVVPFTRGRERSRPVNSIIAEATQLFEKGYREVTLLGQNVDSYKWTEESSGTKTNFAELLEQVALISPLLRVRFSTSHPKDITDQVLLTMAKYENICNYIHLPVQAGNTRILDLMNRTYTREWYLDRVAAIRKYIPECGISTDVITGFCTETEEEFNETLSLMEMVKYDMAYMFYYSERPGTLAARKYADDIPLEVKKERLNKVIALQGIHSLQRNQQDIGKLCKVLVEKDSRRSADDLCGRNDQNKMVIFPKGSQKPGDYVYVKITDCTSATLRGVVVNNQSVNF